MPIHELKRNDNVVLLTITLNDKELQTALEAEAKKASANLTIPGFRAGYAPLDVVLEHVNGDKLREEALLNAVQAAMPEVIKSEGLQLIIPPTLTETKDMSVVIECTEKPAVTVKKLNLKELTSVKPDVKEEDMERAIESQLQPHTTMTPVERAAKAGDQVIVSLSAQNEAGEDLPEFSEENYRVRLGQKALLPGLEEAIIGLKAGGKSSATITIPKEHEREDLRGKPVTFGLQVSGVSEVEIPTLDDSFVKANFKEENVKAFKETLKERLIKQEQTYLFDKRRDQFLDLARKATSVTISDSMKGFRAREVFQNFNADLERSGSTFEQWLKQHNKTQEEAGKELEQAAVDQWITQFGLQHLLKENEIKLEESDVDARLELLTSLIDPKMAPQLKEMYKKDENMMNGLRFKVEIDKLIDALV